MRVLQGTGFVYDKVFVYFCVSHNRFVLWAGLAGPDYRRLLFIHSEIGQNDGLPFCVVSARTMQFPAQGGKSLFRNSEYGYRRVVEPAYFDPVLRFQSFEDFVCPPFFFIGLSVHIFMVLY